MVPLAFINNTKMFILSNIPSVLYTWMYSYIIAFIAQIQIDGNILLVNNVLDKQQYIVFYEVFLKQRKIKLIVQMKINEIRGRSINNMM